jgi:hypothetical protein
MLAKMIFAIAATVALPAFSAPAALPMPEIREIARVEVNAIFGDDRQDAFISNGLLREAVLDGIGMANTPRLLNNGLTLFEDCRPHSCIEKSALLIDGDARLVRAAALLHFNCHRVAPDTGQESDASAVTPQNRCDDAPTLEIFVVRRSATSAQLAREGEYIAALNSWGKSVGFDHENVHVRDLDRKP